MSNVELDHIMGLIGQKYAVDTVPLTIGNRTLKILQIKDYEEYVVDLIDGKGAAIKDLPFWAKVWESSFLLAYFLGKQPVVFGQQMLEIGCGMGIVGIYAALCGHRVTVTDINEDALLFARANALLNAVPQVRVRALDWNSSDLKETYDVILGSEVVYDRQSYPALVRFLRRTLDPKGIIFLAKNAELHAPLFFTELTKYFEFKQNSQTVRTGEQPKEISLYAIRPKQGATAAGAESIKG
jgi:2-polyprenyl-3-methyl-5-hydroxy-6-metoxy-1,4-benzoquinol methylase